ncbi:MAG: arginine deiminase family protein [Bacteroidota bacterium]
MNLHITNENAPLEAVVLGIGTDLGKPIGINPMMRYHIAQGTYPTEATIQAEISTFEQILCANGVRVYRPENLSGVDQIFTRDIGFVIEDKFLVANMQEVSRQPEIKGIQCLLDQIGSSNVIHIPEMVTVEGGDVIVWKEHIFVGVGARTNAAAVTFLQKTFPDKQVHGLELVVDEQNADRHILHLDCAFQPIGTNEAIFYEAGFASRPDAILEVFSTEQLLRVNQAEKNQMFPNIFSIAPHKIVVERHFTRLKQELQARGYQTFDVDYSEIAKAGGLLRCSTLPLRRQKA